MDRELLDIAQAEYLRQYNLWLTSKPDQESILKTVEDLEELVKKYTRNQES